MKKLLFALFVLALLIDARAAKPSIYKQHQFEFGFGPNADYYFYRKGSEFEIDKPYERRYPYAGFSFMAEYEYRPTECFGVSTGLGMQFQHYYGRYEGALIPDYTQVEKYGWMTLPIHFHAYKEMPNSRFTFATGPDFNFPVYRGLRTTTVNPFTDEKETTKSMDKFTTDYMGDFATLGWTIFMGGEINICEHGNVAIGPEIKFLNIASFDKDQNKSGRLNGRFYDVSLGVTARFGIF